MQKDTTPKALEPFTLDEERTLVDKLDTLSVAALQSYIASARAALGSKALAATWRPRIEFGAGHAEKALVKALAVAAALAEAGPVVVPKSKKAIVPVSGEESEQEVDEA